MKQRILWLMILSVLFIAGCSKNTYIETTREPLPSHYKQVVDDIRVVERRNGLPSFSLKAETVIEYSSYFEFQGLGEVLTYSDGTPELKLTASIANWHQRQGLLEAIGDVNLFGIEEEFLLEAPKVNYRTTDETFETHGRSTINTSSYSIFANKLDGDVKEKLLVASGDVLLIDRDGMEVEGSSLEFNWETKDYLIKGPITAVIKQTD